MVNGDTGSAVGASSVLVVVPQTSQISVAYTLMAVRLHVATRDSNSSAMSFFLGLITSTLGSHIVAVVLPSSRHLEPSLALPVGVPESRTFFRRLPELVADNHGVSKPEEVLSV